MRQAILLLISGSLLLSAVPAQQEVPIIPNPDLTPGATLDVSVAELCQHGYEARDRVIPLSVKAQVVQRYNLGPDAVGYNIDHLIPVSLAGSNSLQNLWPQPLTGEWSYQRKNKLEARLRKMLCAGEIDLKKAQQEIAKDWVSAYKKYVGDPAH